MLVGLWESFVLLQFFEADVEPVCLFSQAIARQTLSSLKV